MSLAFSLRACLIWIIIRTLWHVPLVSVLTRLHCNNLSTNHYLIYHPCFDMQFCHAQTTQQYFCTVAMSSRKKRKRSSCPFVPRRAVERKKGNCFDKDFIFSKIPPFYLYVAMVSPYHPQFSRVRNCNSKIHARNCGSRKYPYPYHGGNLKFRTGGEGGWSKTQEIPEGRWVVDVITAAGPILLRLGRATTWRCFGAIFEISPGRRKSRIFPNQKIFSQKYFK